METVSSLPVSILFTMLALCLTLIMAWVVIKFLARIYSARDSNGEIKVRSTYALSTRLQLYIVNLRGTDYFLSVTSDRVDVIDKFPEPISHTESNVTASTAQPANDSTNHS